jgi:hypothetical protein
MQNTQKITKIPENFPETLRQEQSNKVLGAHEKYSDPSNK